MKYAFKISVYGVYSKYYLVIAETFAEAESTFKEIHPNTITKIEQLIDAEVIYIAGINTGK